MPIDSSIALGVKPLQIDSPVNQMAQVLQMQGLQQSNQLNQLKMQQAQVVADRQNKLYSVLGGLGADATPDDHVKALRANGFIDEADKVQSGELNRVKTAADARLANSRGSNFDQDAISTALKNTAPYLNGVNSQDGAATWLRGVYADPILGPMAARLAPLDTAIAGIPSDPEGLKAWKLAHANISPEKLIEMTQAKPTEINQGGTKSFLDTNPQSPTYMKPQGSTITMTATPGEVLTAGTARRGQDLVDARSKESTAAMLGKPFEATATDGTPVLVQQDQSGKVVPVTGYGPKGGANKALTGEQGKATTFAARMQDAESTIKAMEDKGVSGSDFKTIAAGSPYTNFLASSDGQKYRQAQENWVTANLRQESGAAIGKDEMDKDVRKFFPSVNDGPEVKAQKATARAVAMEGMTTQAGPGAASISGMLERSGSGAAKSKSAGKAAPTANSKGWTLHTDASGNKAYVSPDGKSFEEVK